MLIKWKSQTLIAFSHLKVGDLFLLDSGREIFMKINALYLGSEERINAVNLTTFSTIKITDTSRSVTCVKGTLELE